MKTSILTFVLICSIASVYSYSDPSNTLIPGAEVMMAGVNGASMTSLDLPLFDYDYSSGQTWTNPSVPDATYSIPDQVYLIPDPETFLMNESTVVHDVSDMVYYSNYHHSSHTFWLFGTSSSTTNVINFAETFYQEDYSLSLRTMRVSEYKLESYPFQPLGKLATQVLETLPKTYNADSQATYFQFLDAFGTEYVQEAIFGGSVYCYVYFHRCFCDMQSFDWISKQTENSFLGIINTGSQAQYYNSLVDHTFRENSQVNVTLVGGNANVPVDDLWSWIPSIDKNYKLIGMTVRPIYELIVDPNMQANIQQARVDYLAAAGNKLDSLMAQLAAKDPNTKPSWCNSTSSGH